MNPKRHVYTVALSAALLASPADANVVLPLLGPSIVMVVVLIPIIIVEAAVLGWQLGISSWAAIKVAFWANLCSTIIGIPLSFVSLVWLENKISVWKKFDPRTFLFGTCWLASCIVEFIVATYMLADSPEIRSAIILANSISYLLILLVLVLCWITRKSESDRLVMNEIDKVIEQHGGWPDAFHTPDDRERLKAAKPPVESVGYDSPTYVQPQRFRRGPAARTGTRAGGLPPKRYTRVRPPPTLGK